METAFAYRQYDAIKLTILAYITAIKHLEQNNLIMKLVIVL